MPSQKQEKPRRHYTSTNRNRSYYKTITSNAPASYLALALKISETQKDHIVTHSHGYGLLRKGHQREVMFFSDWQARSNPMLSRVHLAAHSNRFEGPKAASGMFARLTTTPNSPEQLIRGQYLEAQLVSAAQYG